MSFTAVSILFLGSLGFSSFAAADAAAVSAVQPLVGNYRFEKNATSAPCLTFYGEELKKEDRIRVSLTQKADGSRTDLQIRYQPYREDIGADSISDTTRWFPLADRADFVAIEKSSIFGPESKVYTKPILQVEHSEKLKSVDPAKKYLSEEDEVHEVQVVSWDPEAQRMTYGVTLVSQNGRGQVTESRVIEMCHLIKVK